MFTESCTDASIREDVVERTARRRDIGFAAEHETTDVLVETHSLLKCNRIRRRFFLQFVFLAIKKQDKLIIGMITIIHE